MKNSTSLLEISDSESGTAAFNGNSPVEPSWFLNASDLASREELMARYRAARNLPDPDSDPRATNSADTYSYRELVSSRPRPPARFLQQAPEKIAKVAPGKAKRSRTELGKTFFAAALLASISGAAAGLASSQFGKLAKGFALLVPEMPAPNTSIPDRDLGAKSPGIASLTTIPKKQVPTATLQVKNVSGETNSLIPLALHAEPALAGQDLILKLSGLPDQAYLTVGEKESDRIWTLRLDDLGKAQLMIPRADQNEIDIAVAAFERATGDLAAPIKTMRIALSDVNVEPASAPPPKASAGKTTLPHGPAAIPLPQKVGFVRTTQREIAVTYAAKGEEHMKKGDIASARVAFEGAWNNGAAEGALGLGRSYDPVVLASLKLKSAEPDTGKAIQWYERAAIAGQGVALDAIIRLRMKPD
jgi:hypothetical protein